MTEADRTQIATEIGRLLEHLETAAAAQTRILSLIDGLPEDDREQFWFERLRTEGMPRINYLRNVHRHLHGELTRRVLAPSPAGRPLGVATR